MSIYKRLQREANHQAAEIQRMWDEEDDDDDLVQELYMAGKRKHNKQSEAIDTEGNSLEETLVVADVEKYPKRIRKTNAIQLEAIDTEGKLLAAAANSEHSSTVDLTGGIHSVIRFRYEELKETKKHRKRELTLKAIMAKEEKQKIKAEIQKIKAETKKLKAETAILQIETFIRHSDAVVQNEMRIKELVDVLGLSRDDAIGKLGKVPEFRTDEDYDEANSEN